MAFAIDPILGNILFTLNTIVHAQRHSTPQFEDPHAEAPENLPTVSILVPLYKETREAVNRTVASIEAQTYPAEKLELVYILEPEDTQTQIPRIEKPIRTIIVRTDGRKSLKAHALNAGLRASSGSIVGVYDADNTIESQQIMKMVTLMDEGLYDVVQPVIIRRSGKAFVSRMLELDNFVWQNKFVPFFKDTVGFFPLSGEGLFIRRWALDDVGGFPEVLSEDAYLAILLGERGRRFGLLNSTVIEEPPRNWRSHFRQRARWFRGYLQCLRRLLLGNLSVRKKLLLAVSFMAPITCAISLVSWGLFVLFWTTWLVDTSAYHAPWMQAFFYSNVVYYWSAALAYIGNVFIVFSLFYSIIDTSYEKRAHFALLAPLYWMFLGVAALASLFRGTRIFGRTERE